MMTHHLLKMHWIYQFRIKKLKLKVQVKIQGDELRVDGKKKDDLQQAIVTIKTIDLGLPIEFTNFRD